MIILDYIGHRRS